MKYVGSKKAIFKYVAPIILKDRKQDQWYVEPFAGGFNSIIQVDGLRLANDINFYVTQMFLAFQLGWQPPDFVTKEEYYEIKNNKEKYPPELVGWVINQCSFNGSIDSGYMGCFKTRNYQQEAVKRLHKELPKIKGLVITNHSYEKVTIPEKSIIYCDPPYKQLDVYGTNFDTEIFFEWCRKMCSEKHIVFISELEAPDDFRCVWKKEKVCTLNVKKKHTQNEKLFVYKDAA